MSIFVVLWKSLPQGTPLYRRLIKTVPYQTVIDATQARSAGDLSEPDGQTHMTSVWNKTWAPRFVWFPGILLQRVGVRNNKHWLTLSHGRSSVGYFEHETSHQTCVMSHWHWQTNTGVPIDRLTLGPIPLSETHPGPQQSVQTPHCPNKKQMQINMPSHSESPQPKQHNPRGIISVQPKKYTFYTATRSRVNIKHCVFFEHKTHQSEVRCDESWWKSCLFMSERVSKQRAPEHRLYLFVSSWSVKHHGLWMFLFCYPPIMHCRPQKHSENQTLT